MDAGDGQIMVEALADFLKIAHGPVHQKVAETSELVETQKSCFASGDEMVGSTVTESSKSEELIQFGIWEVLSALESEEWASTFAGIVQDATVMRDNESGIARIEAKFVAPTPSIPARTFSLLRFSKKLEEEEGGSVVAVVEVSDPNGQRGYFNRFPSGVLLKKVGEGSTQVIWVEHCEVNDDFLGAALEDSDLRAFTSDRWLSVLKNKLTHSRTEVQGCAPDRFLLEDTFTIQTTVKKMVGEMLEVITPANEENGWSVITSSDLSRVIHKNQKCFLIDTSWLPKDPEAVYQSFREQRHLWHASRNDTLDVLEDYGDGTSILRRRSTIPGRLQQLIFQHVSPRMMVFSRLDHLHPHDLLTEGFTIIPCKNCSLLTMVLVYKVPDGADLALENDKISALQHLKDKFYSFPSHLLA